MLSFLEYRLQLGVAKFGRIEGDLSQVAELRIVDDHPLYEYRDPTTRSMQFIMLKDKFAHPRISVQVDTRDPNDILFEMVGDGDEIASKHIGKHWEDAARWEFDYGKRVVMDGNSVIFKELREQNEDIIPQKKIRGELPSYLMPTTVFGSSSAFAQRAESGILDLESSVRDLTDDNPKVRRNARDELIASGPSAVAPMLKAWHENPANYRTRVGATVVLNDILRNDASSANKISKNLTNDDIRLLVSSLSDTNKTVRLQTTEFLYSLKDKRVVDNTLDAIRNNSNENGVYNILLILKELAP